MLGRLVPNGKKATMAPILGQDGKLATSEEEIMEAWGDHQERLGTPSRHPMQDDMFGEWVENELKRHMEEEGNGDTGALGAPFTITE